MGELIPVWSRAIPVLWLWRGTWGERQRGAKPLHDNCGRRALPSVRVGVSPTGEGMRGGLVPRNIL